MTDHKPTQAQQNKVEHEANARNIDAKTDPNSSERLTKDELTRLNSDGTIAPTEKEAPTYAEVRGEDGDKDRSPHDPLSSDEAQTLGAKNLK